MKNFLKSKLVRNLCLIIFLIYIIVVIVNQQQTLISYNSQKKYYASKIDEAKEYNETLLTTKENLDSSEYIEAIAREKLDMYSDKETVYININK